MANDLTEVTPKLLAQGLMALRQNAVMPRIVNSDYGPNAREKGSSVDVPIPSAISTNDVAPGPTPPATQDSTPTKVTLELDQWREAPFYLTDKDLVECMNGTIPLQASEAIKALANYVDGYILAQYKEVSGFAGTPGTTPFGSDTSELVFARKVLNNQLAPQGDRRFVFDADCEANALLLRAFTDVSFTGDARAINEGEIVHKFGFDWFMDQNMPAHTAGTITTGLSAKAATGQAIGDQTIVCTTAATSGACDLKEGDIITFAGHDQTYVVTADTAEASASTDVTVPISPGLKVALVGGEAVALKASHAINLAFHRDAIAFANRPLDGQARGLGSLIQTAQDPVSGLALRLEISREHKRNRFSYDILFGSQLIRPELACRLAG
jgi:hypothetical protein